jgi:hypothetical protein
MRASRSAVRGAPFVVLLLLALVGCQPRLPAVSPSVREPLAAAAMLLDHLVYVTSEGVWRTTATGSHTDFLVGGRSAVVSPDGRYVAYLESAAQGGRVRANPALKVVDIDGTDVRTLVPSSTGEYGQDLPSFVWASDAHAIAFVLLRGTSRPGRLDLMEVRTIDPATGAANTVHSEDLPNTGVVPELLGWSAQRGEVYLVQDAAPKLHVLSVQRRNVSSLALPTPDRTRPLTSRLTLALSRDYDRIAVVTSSSSRERSNEIVVQDLRGQERHAVVGNPQPCRTYLHVVWSPDTRYLAYYAQYGCVRTGSLPQGGRPAAEYEGVWVAEVEAGRTWRVAEDWVSGMSWHPGGQFLGFWRRAGLDGADLLLHTVRPDGTDRRDLLLARDQRAPGQLRFAGWSR